MNNNYNNLNQNNMNLNYNNTNINDNNQNIISSNNDFSNDNNKSKRKKLLVVGILLVLAIVLFIGSIFLKSKNANIKKSENVNLIFDEEALIKVKKDNKYGYIDTNGKFVLDPIYKEAKDFYGNYTIVETKDEIYQVIDKKGKAKFQSKYAADIDYNSENNIWILNHQLYDSALNKISPDNINVRYGNYEYLKWEDVNEKSAGIINSSGKITYTYKYQNDENYFDMTPSKITSILDEQYCIVNVDSGKYEKYGIVNCATGKLVYDYSKYYISDRGDNIFKITNEDSQDSVSLIYIKDNKIAYQTNSESDTYEYDILTKYIQIFNEDKNDYFYLDIQTGKILSDAPNDDINDEWEVLTGITKKGCGESYGLVKGKKKILSCEWDSIDYFGNLLYQYLASKGKKYVMTTKDDKSFIINLTNGETVAKFNANKIYNNEESIFVFYEDSSINKKVIYNLITGKTMETDIDNNVRLNSNYITIYENNKINFYNTNFKLIYSAEDVI